MNRGPSLRRRLSRLEAIVELQVVDEGPPTVMVYIPDNGRDASPKTIRTGRALIRICSTQELLELTPDGKTPTAATS
jgi:hypothetical protein